MNEQLLREYVRNLLLEGRGGIDAQVAVALYVIEQGKGKVAVVAPGGSTVPDVVIDGRDAFEVKSDKKASGTKMNVSPFDLTVTNSPNDPKAEDFQPMINTIISKAIELGNIKKSDVKRWDTNEDSIIQFSEYVAAVGGGYTPGIQANAPTSWPGVYTVAPSTDETKDVHLKDADGEVFKLGASGGVKALLKVGAQIKLSHKLDTSSGGGKNVFVEAGSQHGLGTPVPDKKDPEKETGERSYQDANNVAEKVGIWMLLPGEKTVRKQSTLKVVGSEPATKVWSKSEWRVSGGSSLPTGKKGEGGQYGVFGKDVFVDEEVMSMAARLWAAHLYKGGDRYIAVVSGRTIYLLGVTGDPLKITGGKSLGTLGAAAVQKMRFATYGASGVDQMRATPHLTLKPSVFVKVTAPARVSQAVLDSQQVTDNLGAVLKSYVNGKADFGDKKDRDKERAGQHIGLNPAYWTSNKFTTTSLSARRANAPGGWGDSYEQKGKPESREYDKLRLLVYETLLLEELTKTDKKEIERIARKQAQKEIVKVVGNDLAKTIKEEVKRVLKNKATKDEIADVTRAVIKKIIDEIKI